METHTIACCYLFQLTICIAFFLSAIHGCGLGCRLLSDAVGAAAMPLLVSRSILRMVIR